jgi:hypothetical protein
MMSRKFQKFPRVCRYRSKIENQSRKNWSIDRIPPPIDDPVPWPPGRSNAKTETRRQSLLPARVQPRGRRPSHGHKSPAGRAVCTGRRRRFRPQVEFRDQPPNSRVRRKQSARNLPNCQRTNQHDDSLAPPRQIPCCIAEKSPLTVGSECQRALRNYGKNIEREEGVSVVHLSANDRDQQNTFERSCGSPCQITQKYGLSHFG